MSGHPKGGTVSAVGVQIPGLFRSVDRHDRPLGQLLAGLTLASIAVPEVLGFARIAGMPVATGLATMVAPAVVFVAFCSSRRLVVGADSATAAILAAGLGGLAVAGSPEYVRLAGAVAVATGVVLVVARFLRLGFLADFLSRTVLVGFLAGVGIQVSVRQLPDMVGIPVHGSGTVDTLVGVVGHIGSANPTDVVLSALTIAVVVVGGRLAPRVPWALFVLVASIAVTGGAGLDVATVDDVRAGVPMPAWPAVAAEHLWPLVPTVLAVAVVVLAQSAATGRAFADRHGEHDDVDEDLLGLGVANLVSGFTGSFTINGSPSRTQILDVVGGRNQLAQLTAAAGGLVALLFLAPALTHLPYAVLASIVAVLTLHLVDLGAIRDVFRRRPVEGWVAVAATVTVVVLGVGPGILFASLLSVGVHLRHSYRPNTRLVGRDGRRWRMSRLEHTREADPGLVIYFVPSNLYYANSTHVTEEVLELVARARPPVAWMCLFAISVDDVDLTASDALRRLVGDLRSRGVELVMCGVQPHVHRELTRDGIVELVGDDRFFDYLEDVVAAFRARS